jgi:dCTP deaminase
MSILTKSALESALERGEVQIEPALDPDQVREASIDLRLGNTFRIYEKTNEPIAIKEATDYKDFTKEVVTEQIMLLPQETILGVTLEKITLPNYLCGWLEGRSRFARLGLLIHISAGLIQPGVSNKQVLEITNLSPNVLILHAGEKICQLALQRCEGNAAYTGKFNGQETP